MSKLKHFKSSRIAMKSLITVGLAVAAMGCAADTGAEGADSTDGIPLEEAAAPFAANDKTDGNGEKACTSRGDWTQTITIGSGSWGSWGCMDFCPNDSFVYNIQLRSEGSQGSGDDTALNGVSMGCFNRFNGAFTGNVNSTIGQYGGWLAGANTSPFATNNPVVGGQMRIEAPQGSGDDTAANALSFRALNGVFSTPTAATSWGSWGGVSSCGAGRAVCGISTRVEASQGSSDDTMLNGVQFACCNF